MVLLSCSFGDAREIVVFYQLDEILFVQNLKTLISRMPGK